MIQTVRKTQPTKKLETVLIGTSLTEASDAVVRAGVAVARRAGAKIHLVHAYSPPMTYSGAAFLPEMPLAEVLTAERIGVQRQMESQIERLGIARDELAAATLEMGPAHQVVVEAAERVAAGLIVVGAAEAPRLARVFGSTADRVVRKASGPVLVVRGELRVPPRRVLFPVDLSPLSADAFTVGLDWLAQIAPRAEGAAAPAPEVEALYVVSAKDRPAAAEDGEMKPPMEAQAELMHFVAGLTYQTGWSVTARVAAGYLDSEILDRIERWAPDLVILGTHGRGGFERFLLGSVAATIVREAWMSTLVIPPRAAREAVHPARAEAHAA